METEIKIINGRTVCDTTARAAASAAQKAADKLAVDLTDYAQKSELPTKTSQLTNDKGYITGYTETDPTVPSWAKAASKPSYTKGEVGLGNVENVKQYSASNPPPYPVKSVNGKTGAVQLGASDVGARPATWMPTAQEIGALPATYTLPVATETALGGVKAAAATEEMTQPVGITAEGKLVTVPVQNFAPLRIVDNDTGKTYIAEIQVTNGKPVCVYDEFTGE